MTEYNWVDGTLGPWTTTGDATVVYSSLFGRNVLRCNAPSWSSPAWVSMAYANTVGKWEIEFSKDSNPFFKLSICSNHNENPPSTWYATEELYVSRYSYGGYYNMGRFNSGTQTASTNYTTSISNGTIHTLALERLADGTTTMIVDGTVRKTMSIPDNVLPNGLNLVMGATDAGTLYINKLTITLPAANTTVTQEDTPITQYQPNDPTLSIGSKMVPDASLLNCSIDNPYIVTHLDRLISVDSLDEIGCSATTPAIHTNCYRLHPPLAEANLTTKRPKIIENGYDDDEIIDPLEYAFRLPKRNPFRKYRRVY